FQFDAVRAVAIEDTVVQVPGVQAVHAYPRTASVVVWYSPGECDSAAVLSAIAHAKRVPADVVPARAPRSAHDRRAGLTQRVIDWSVRTRSGSGDVVSKPRTVDDGCCEHDENGPEPQRFWDVVKLRRAAVSGALLTTS